MSKEQYYIVFYSEGSHGDYSVIELFVTKDFEYAQNYCRKFNRILFKWQEYFDQFKESMWDDTLPLHVKERCIQIYETNIASISKINYR
jgi:hypothetical protein